MKIILSTTFDKTNELKEIVQSMIVNREEWEKGRDKKLKYKFGAAIVEDVSIEIK